MPTANEQLIDACTKGDFKKIKNLVLKQNADVNAAVEVGRVEGRILETTPLLEACSRARYTNKQKIIQFLLEHGADAAQLGKDGSPLHVESTRDDTEIVALLLASKTVKINQRDEAGETALFKACESERRAIVVDQLIEADADVNQGNFANFTPLHLACKKHNQDIVERLLRCPDIQIDSTCNIGFTPLHTLSYNPRLGSEHIAEQLIDHGADINKETHKGSTPFYFALYQMRGKKDKQGNKLLAAPLVKLFLTYDNLLIKDKHSPRRLYSKPGTIGEYIDLYNRNYLKKLNYEMAQFRADNPYHTFDFTEVDEERSQGLFVFHMLSYMIEQGGTLAAIKQLLFIPKVLHYASIKDNAITLLKAADKSENEDIISLLLTIPEIRDAAAAGEFSPTMDRLVAQSEPLGMIDLAPFAPPQAPESLLFLERHYFATVEEQGGVAAVIESLKQRLRNHYAADDVPAGNLAYADPYYTAERYFLDPNPLSADGQGSTFEKHLALIAYLWVAANDATRPPEEDGITVADRIDAFIQQIALLNRFYNQNDVPPAIPGDEDIADHAQGDKPLCDFQGVNTLLLHGLKHHPLCKPKNRAPVMCYIEAGPADPRPPEALSEEEALQQSVDQAAIEYLFGLADPTSEEAFLKFNQLVDTICQDGVGCIWDAIKVQAKAYYLAKRTPVFDWNDIDDEVGDIEPDINADAVDAFIEEGRPALLSEDALNVLANEIHNAVTQSLGYQNYCKNAHPHRGEAASNGKTPFWTQVAKDKQPSELIVCLRHAAEKHREKSRSSDERKNEIDDLIDQWEALPDHDIVKKLCALFEEKKGGFNKGWSENAFRSWTVWFLFHELQETGLKNLQHDQFAPLPKRKDGSISIRHECNWHTNATVPILCNALREQYPAPNAERRAVLHPFS